MPPVGVAVGVGVGTGVGVTTGVGVAGVGVGGVGGVSTGVGIGVGEGVGVDVGGGVGVLVGGGVGVSVGGGVGVSVVGVGVGGPIVWPIAVAAPAWRTRRRMNAIPQKAMNLRQRPAPPGRKVPRDLISLDLRSSRLEGRSKSTSRPPGRSLLPPRAHAVRPACAAHRRTLRIDDQYAPRRRWHGTSSISTHLRA
jgi:hypothetical protein